MGGEKFKVYKNAIKRTSLLSIHLDQTDLVDEGLLHGQENFFLCRTNREILGGLINIINLLLHFHF